MTNIYIGIEETCRQKPTELPRRMANEFHFVIEDADDLLRLFRWARDPAQDYSLCTMVASDERQIEDGVFKLYYVLSASQDELLIIEHPLSDPQKPTRYMSIRDVYPAVEPLEKEIYDLFGLLPDKDDTVIPGGFVLHAGFPGDLFPLRRSHSMAELVDITNKSEKGGKPPQPELPNGVLILPVGPIHAGVIEAGHFPFHIAGEVVEQLPIRLGYKHRGIEKLFETEYTLENGWELAEKVSGDSSFAHSLAFCQAVESLAGVELTRSAQCWRALFLELERLYNHVSDIGALVHDIAFDLVGSQFAVLREEAVQLNFRLSGHRLLRGVIRPGGMKFKDKPDLEDIRFTVNRLTDQFFALSKLVFNSPTCRERMLSTGILTAWESRICGAVGVAARSVAWDDPEEWMRHDYRLLHPLGAYSDPEINAEIRATIMPNGPKTERRITVDNNDLQGDVFARFALRVAEVETSARIIGRLITYLGVLAEPNLVLISDNLMTAPDFECGLGYVEGWRGNIFYWVMKGSENEIYRCKVRDPSVFNWPAMSRAVICKQKDGKKLENILADFPLINKSFNLSYAGHDL
jgi:Ni,Fe-hydrogenase III large subunit/Ni,Fe-hydrogenase III component G